jgi:hypothetical protein
MSKEPCGGLPTESWSVSLHFCVTHQAYTGNVMRYREAGGEPEVISNCHIAHGPFDSWADIRDWMIDQLPMDGLDPLA